MTDWRVLLLSAIAFLIVLTGLLVLALPDPYEGETIYTLDATHSVRALDGIGLVLLAMGSILSWGAGALWQRYVIH